MEVEGVGAADRPRHPPGREGGPAWKPAGPPLHPSIQPSARLPMSCRPLIADQARRRARGSPGPPCPPAAAAADACKLPPRNIRPKVWPEGKGQPAAAVRIPHSACPWCENDEGVAAAAEATSSSKVLAGEAWNLAASRLVLEVLKVQSASTPILRDAMQRWDVTGCARRPVSVPRRPPTGAPGGH
ncbi:hypothetical protein PCL_08512 [Purpureocillium lilacinum]|uniref:Uncharacterized protein n=1 Tax=Purpureocillium lilacinum TaxID=33203 RepID=A0A2U3DRC3_PURLI|nr:hypothetical protein PCL_08512 [Purpureocillium lilacinum]